MKVAVTTSDKGLDAPVDPRFGRAPCFVFVDVDTMEAETVENENVTAPGGAGPQAAQLVADKQAEVVLTGNCGPNAYRTLRAAGIQVVVGVEGTAREAVEKFNSGEYAPSDDANVDAKFGI
ncbi:MAG: NifB/NifX family molybdenum-iron cluster-binding protein [Planctomycetota bacterium]